MKRLKDFCQRLPSAETQRQTSEAYGTKIAARVKAVYDEALDVPIDRRTATINSALDDNPQTSQPPIPLIQRQSANRHQLRFHYGLEITTAIRRRFFITQFMKKYFHLIEKLLDSLSEIN